MLHILLVFSMALSALPDGTTDETDSSERVKVATPIVIRVATRDILIERCGNDPKACTHFIGYRFESTCSGDDGSVRARATAHFRPLIFLFETPGRLLDHELLHVTDVRNALDAYIVELEKRRFTSLEPCEAMIHAENESFRNHLRQFAHVSNERRR